MLTPVRPMHGKLTHWPPRRKLDHAIASKRLRHNDAKFFFCWDGGCGGAAYNTPRTTKPMIAPIKMLMGIATDKAIAIAMV